MPIRVIPHFSIMGNVDDTVLLGAVHVLLSISYCYFMLRPAQNILGPVKGQGISFTKFFHRFVVSKFVKLVSDGLIQNSD